MKRLTIVMLLGISGSLAGCNCGGSNPNPGGDGGMCIAAAMQQWNLHRRIALTIMRAIGTDPRRLLFGLLAATAEVLPELGEEIRASLGGGGRGTAPWDVA